MAHILSPPDGAAYLDPEEVFRRLREEFDYTAIDRDEGADVVGEIVAKLVELNAPQEVIDFQRASQDRAIQVVIANDATSDDYLQFTVKPNNGIFIGYSSSQHESATRRLVERCAQVLNYQINLL
ncbi:hypothetical protein [Blastopirellula marina]|uniref:Uncharacterized protein n=1 Tax=Blastopirellula marina TaxID=124 RepID=A0A2S8FHL3_9BACT|nr:hypothetical protein [Blastopirellula marina]PQO31652.1 hypothetical protein C5Y98_19750 [Blastopirellula marina]PTL42959.1 hypothetical protein C5Y97_19760 [Blastopirellula marina]